VTDQIVTQISNADPLSQMQGLPNSLLRTDWRSFMWRRCINRRQFMLIDRSRGMTVQCFCDITNWTNRTCGFEASC